MRVAIVDDEKKVRDVLEEYIKRFVDESGLRIGVTSYDSGDSLLEDYKLIFDIIIFDIDMPGTNGMNTAKKIRQVDKNVTIIFITNIAQYAINGYEVDAIDYIIKPISYYDFSMKFHKTVAIAAQKKDHVIMVATMEGFRRLRVSNIIYLEVISHYVYFYTLNSTYKVRGSIKDQEEVLKTYNFVRVHKSYLVNLEFVEEFKGKDVIVRGKQIPVGRGYKDSLKQGYMKYIRGEA